MKININNVSEVDSMHPGYDMMKMTLYFSGLPLNNPKL